MFKHNGSIEYGKENYREELKFDRKVKQKCERCNLEQLILTRPIYKVEGYQVVHKDAIWLCTPCHKIREVN